MPRKPAAALAPRGIERWGTLLGDRPILMRIWHPFGMWAVVDLRTAFVLGTIRAGKRFNRKWWKSRSTLDWLDALGG